MKRWLVIAAWNVGAIIIVLALIELGLRFTPFDTARNPPADNPPNYYVADETLGVRIKPNYPKSWFGFRGPGHEVYSNELGCFDRPVKLKKDEPYILAIGDSFTWGYNPLEAKWTSVIERRTGTRVVKCGVPGIGTRYQLHHLRQLLKQLPHPPETVIHLYDTTDFNDDFIFPGETVIDGLRVENLNRVRLSDGKRLNDETKLAVGRSGQLYGAPKSRQTRPFVLPSLLGIALVVDGQVEKRRLVIGGLSPEYLHWRYEFNLLLLDPDKYPYVAQQLESHINVLKDIRSEVQNAGATYVLFHTNSFRLPSDRPLVRRLDQFFASLPEFKGRLPELGRHMFDPHWNADSEQQVASFMLERLNDRALASGSSRKVSHGTSPN